MSLSKDIQINELYYLKHLHDDLKHQNYDWSSNLLRKTTSAHMWKNPTMNQFLTRLEKMTVLMVEKMLIARNFFVYTKGKYDNNHWG